MDELFRLNIVSPLERNNLKTNVAVAPKLYGLPKIHKEGFPLRPICSSINSPSYSLCKYITSILHKLTVDSKYNVRNSLEFRDKIKNLRIEENEELISLDVVSLFPSIPVELAIRIIEDDWDRISGYTNINKDLFLRILKFCIIDSRYFQFNNKIFSQKKGLPMGSPASPVVADIVMEKLIDSCLEKLHVKPKIMIKYVDDLFCVIKEEDINLLLTTLNSFDPRIKFTIERENNNRISYLDALVVRRGDKLWIDWYQKPTSSGRIINYYSKHPKRMIINTARNFINRVFNISDFRFHKKNAKLIEGILIENSFPNKLICKLIRQYDRRNVSNVNTEPVIYKSLSYVPGMSERLEKSDIFDKRKYRIAHKIYRTVGGLFSRTKDKLNKLEKSNLVYQIPCGGKDGQQCDKVYVGTTKNKLRTRIAGHKSDQRYRNINSSQKTALSTHCRDFDHNPDFEKVSILSTESSYRKRYMLEMLQIINIPTGRRINFRKDTENLAQNYRQLICKNKLGI